MLGRRRGGDLPLERARRTAIPSINPSHHLWPALQTSVFAPTPTRRLSLDPADDHEQDGEECERCEKVWKIPIGTEKQSGHSKPGRLASRSRPRPEQAISILFESTTGSLQDLGVECAVIA